MKIPLPYFIAEGEFLQLTQKDKDILLAYGQKVDFSDKEALKLIVEYCLRGQQMLKKQNTHE